MSTSRFKENKTLVVKKSKNGEGLFSKVAFTPEQKIFEVTGTFVSGDIDDEMIDTTRSNTYRYNEDVYISPQGRVGDFLNHSCNPNTKVIKEKSKLYIVAIKNIAPNREIMFDYSTTLASDDIWKMKCSCKSTRCRGTIRRFISLPKEIRTRYIQQHIVPSYILEI